MAHRTVLRTRALLLAGDGVANNEIAQRVGVNPNSVRMWRQRFIEEGSEGMGKVAPGRGRKPSLPEGTVAEVVAITMNELPDGGSTQWSTRTLAKRVGMSFPRTYSRRSLPANLALRILAGSSATGALVTRR